MDEIQIHRTPNELGFAMLEAISGGDIQEGSFPLEHHFAEGLYGRRIFCSAGSVIVTMKHLQQHLSIALKGHCTVVDEHGKKKEVFAPNVWVTEAGTQRSIYCHTDVEWITVHANPDGIEDVEEIETSFAENPFPEFRKVIADKKDYLLVLDELGITEPEARFISEQTHDRIEDDEIDIKIAPSNRQGLGVFASKKFEPDDFVAVVRIGNKRQNSGRYMNHSANPNVKYVLVGDEVHAIAINEIKPEAEILVNYRDVKQIAIKANDQQMEAL